MTIKPGQLLINGKWQKATMGKTFSTTNPATEEVITQIQEADNGDVDLAVRAARAAFDEGPWPAMSPADRGKILFKIADLLEKYIDDVAMIETLDCGKPLWQTQSVEIPLSAETFRYYAGWTTKIAGETLPVHGNHLNYIMREPIGVVAAIPPWNYPLLLASWKVAPALAAGNTVVLKPSSQTPLSAIRLAEIAQEAGLPDGVLNLVTGPGSTVGMALVRHPGVDKVAFTGETTTGRTIMKECAATMKRLSLELGGKSPSVVFADADLELAAAGVFNSIYFNKGESCAAGSRLLVEKSVHEKLMSMLVERVKKTSVGDPLDANTWMGPVISKSQLDKILQYVEIGKKEGAKLAAGGERVKVGTGKGYYIQPTLFDQVRNTMRIAQEEVFGPFLSVIPFTNADDVVALANGTPYGLAANVFTRDVKKAHTMARKIRSGTVWINPPYAMFDPASPFGGYKQSGFGRELGPEALQEYTQVKSVWVNLD